MSKFTIEERRNLRTQIAISMTRGFAITGGTIQFQPERILQQADALVAEIDRVNQQEHTIEMARLRGLPAGEKARVLVPGTDCGQPCNYAV